MAKQFIWKLWLRLNLLTKDINNDYVAEVSTTGNTLHNEDIARHIVKGRSELRYETIVGILQERDTIVLETLLSGSSVQDGNIHLAPRITGNWEGITPHFDPEKHKITVDATPTGELRKALHEEVGIEILGVKADGGAAIGLVTDITTGKTDGTLTPDGDLVIEGEKIRIAPVDGDGLGIFFVDAGGTETPVTRPLTQNDPKKIVCRIPALTAGNYTLKIVTMFSSSSHLLKTPRTIIYANPLTVL
jgi:hypothetical protein